MVFGVLRFALCAAKQNCVRQSVVHERDSPDRIALRRCEIYRNSFPMTEIALPAYALRNLAVMRGAIDVRSGKELAVAIAAGIHPLR